MTTTKPTFLWQKCKSRKTMKKSSNKMNPSKSLGKINQQRNEGNKMTYTPGPWTWNSGSLQHTGKSEHIATIMNDDGCTVYRESPVDDFNAEIDANKRLIAAAPDLLEALVKLMEAWPEGMACEQSASAAFDDAYAALAKVNGD